MVTLDEARCEAERAVFAKILKSATAESMNREAHMGHGGPNEPGYDLSRGRITVPGIGKPGPRHTFRTDVLVAGIEAREREDFWRLWRRFRWDGGGEGYLEVQIRRMRLLGITSGLLPVPPGPAWPPTVEGEALMPKGEQMDMFGEPA
jgi:hypothetical protein